MKKIIFSFVVITIAIISQSFYQNAPNPSIQNGKNVYATYCISCHMENGEGIESAFPSLVKTGNLTDKNRLVKIILQGMRGPIIVKGKKYNAEMASLDLTDKEVTDVINYIRNSWGNKAPLLQISEVPAAKKAVVNGYQPY
jgi:nitrite reductase (NO-forming)